MKWEARLDLSWNLLELTEQEERKARKAGAVLLRLEALWLLLPGSRKEACVRLEPLQGSAVGTLRVYDQTAVTAAQCPEFRLHEVWMFSGHQPSGSEAPLDSSTTLRKTFLVRIFMCSPTTPLHTTPPPQGSPFNGFN